MKKVLKWVGFVLGGLVVLAVVAAAGLYLRGKTVINHSYTVPVEAVAISTDPAVIERGRHLANVICADCHGDDYGGKPGWFQSAQLGTIDSANLTAGQGGIGSLYQTAEDYVRAVRHGVNPAGNAIYMPAVLSLNHMSDDDLSAVISYLKTLPPVDRATHGNDRLTPVAVMLIGAGQFKMQADQVDHSQMRVSAPPAGVTPEYGQYLAAIMHCDECHGAQLSGGRHPDPTVKVYGPNLTPGGELRAWTEDDFLKALHTGTTPSGRQLSSYMPWAGFGRMTDDELKAIWVYLQSLPARETTLQ